jgi:hypothetical protein
LCPLLPTTPDVPRSFTYVPSTAYNAMRSALDAYCQASTTTAAGGRRCVGTKVTIAREDYCVRLSHASDLASYPGAWACS